MRLPALYLLDSIAKMVGEPYKSHFAPSLPGVRGWRLAFPHVTGWRLRARSVLGLALCVPRFPATSLLFVRQTCRSHPRTHPPPHALQVFEASWNAGVSRAALGKLAATWEGVFPPDCVAGVRAVMRGPAQYPGAMEPAATPYGAAYAGGGADDYGRGAYPLSLIHI